MRSCYHYLYVTPSRRGVVSPDFLAILAFPFVYNYLFHLGFYSFVYSLPIFFLFSGYWLRHATEPTIGRNVTIAALSLLLYFSHLVSLVGAYVELVLLTMWPRLVRMIAKVRAGRSQDVMTRTDRRAADYGLVVALTPTCILALIFAGSNSALAIFQGENLSVDGWGLLGDWGLRRHLQFEQLGEQDGFLTFGAVAAETQSPFETWHSSHRRSPTARSPHKVHS